MRHSLRLILVLGLNAALIAIWLWARGEQQTITVVVTPMAVTAYDQSGQPLASALGGGSGRVGLYLSSRPLPGRQPPLDAPPAILAWLGRQSAWESITVYRNSDHAVLYHKDLVSGIGILLPGEPVSQIVEFGNPDWTDYTVQATLLRGRSMVGIEVLANGNGGKIFLLRPEYRDGWWSNVVPGGFSAPLASIPYQAYSKNFLSVGQEVIRLFLGAYPAALILALVFGAVGALGGVVRRKRLSPSLREVEAAAPADPAAIEVVSADDGASGSRGGSPRQSRAERMAPTAVALVFSVIGLAIGVWVAVDELQMIPHVQDSVAYLFQAKVFALGRLWVPTPKLPQFFTHEFVVMYDGKWFGKYPPGQPMMLALGVLAGVPWLVAPIAAGLSVLLIYLIGRRVYGWPTGLLAAGLALVSPFFTFLSGSMMAHMDSLLFVLLFVWLFLKDGRKLTALLAGAAIGMAFLIRPWTAGMIGVPFAVVALVDLARALGKRLPRYATMVAGFVPFVLAWLGYNAALTGSPFKDTMVLWWPFDTVGFGPNHGPFGFYPADGLYNTTRNLTELQSHLFGWPPYLTLLFIALPFVLLRARREDWLFLAAFVCLVAGYAAWWADGIMFGPRFYFESIGFLLLLTARGVFELGGLVRRAVHRWGAPRRASDRAGFAFAGVLLALLIGYNLYYYMPVQIQLYKGYNYVNAGPIDAVKKAGIHNALVFTYVGQWYEWWNYGMVFSSNSPLLDGDVVYARDLGDAADRQLMALYPGRSYYRLQGTTLTPLPGP